MNSRPLTRPRRAPAGPRVPESAGAPLTQWDSKNHHGDWNHHGDSKRRHQGGGRPSMRSGALLAPARPPPPGAGELRAEVRVSRAGTRGAGRFANASDAWLSGRDDALSRLLAARGW